jgi:hypothetical protein
MEARPKRVLLYVCLTDMPGNPQARHTMLGNAFCRFIIQRDFQQQPEPSGYDHIHIPPDFDSIKPLKRWFILDLGVVETLDETQVSQIPHKVYLASHQGHEWSVLIPY